MRKSYEERKDEAQEAANQGLLGKSKRKLKKAFRVAEKAGLEVDRDDVERQLYSRATDHLLKHAYQSASRGEVWAMDHWLSKIPKAAELGGVEIEEYESLASSFREMAEREASPLDKQVDESAW